MHFELNKFSLVTTLLSTQYPYVYNYIYLVFPAIVIPFGTLGNLCALLTLCLGKVKRRPVNVLLIGKLNTIVKVLVSFKCFF